jgi:hypothetical protein
MEQDASLADIRKESSSKIIASRLVLNTSDTVKMKLMMRKVHDIIESRMLVQIILIKRGNMYRMPMLQHTSDNKQISHLSGETQHHDNNNEQISHLWNQKI